MTPGALSISLILAWYDGGTRQYTSYTTRKQTSPITGDTATQAADRSAGRWQDLDIGHAIYTFKTALPEGFDLTKTHTLGIYATRDTTTSSAEELLRQRRVRLPSRRRGASREAWDLASNAACNTCHNPLSAHGGARQDVKLCVLCHQPQTTTPTPATRSTSR